MDTTDLLVKAYQETGESAELVKTYHPFLIKYYKMFAENHIDFDNYDIRKFLCCYIKDEHVRAGLIRGRFRSREAINESRNVLNYISKAFQDYEVYKPWDKRYPYDDIYNELLILFLECAKDYEDQGIGFQRYLYHYYRYKLKKYVDAKLFDGTGKSISYCEDYGSEEDSPVEDGIIQYYEDNPFNLIVDKDMPLSQNLLWMNGIECNPLFKDLDYMERTILVLAFELKKSDIEIAKLTGLHHRSVYRIKKRLVDYYQKLRAKGDIKWVR